MRQNKSGAFEIYFVSEEGEENENGACIWRPMLGTKILMSAGARRFKEVFNPTPGTSPDASEANDPGSEMPK